MAEENAAPTIGAPRSDAPTAGGIALGTVIARRYRIVELVGRGGMSAVYRARDLALGADVAVKLLAYRGGGDGAAVEAFRNEVKLARKVTHPNVCRLHDLVETDEHWLITMEHVDGESLAQRLDRGGPPVALEAATAIVRDVAAGLAAAHRAGVIHRDLKPANVLVEAETGRIVVADFGIAFDAQLAAQSAGEVAGTRGYMSPEQTAGKTVDARTDIYALGVLAHRMVTGELPGAAPAGAIPPALEPFIRACLEVDPDRRPADVAAAIALLPERAAPRRRRALVAGGIVVGAIAAVTVAIAIPADDGGDRAPAPAPPAAAPSIAPTDYVVDAIAHALPPHAAWQADAVRRIIVDDLDDAWGMPADVVGDPTRGTARVSGRLLVIATGRLRLHLDVRGPGGPRALDIDAPTLRELGQTAARELVAATVPAAQRHPTAVELAADGASDPEAWRDWRRAQSHSLMQRWNLTRAEAERAIARDPGFPLPYLELAFLTDRQDRATLAAVRRAVEVAERTPTLDPFWKTVFEAVDAGNFGSPDRTRELVEMLKAMPLDERRAHFLAMRWAMYMHFTLDRAGSLPELELIAEKWPRRGAASKLLATYHLLQSGPEAARAAVRHATRAVDLAADDLGARADLALAYARAGERERALALADALNRADPEEKRAAVTGGEDKNSIFELNMSLGEIEQAAVDARRMLTGAPIEAAHARSQLAWIALNQGQIDVGLDELAAAADAYTALGRDAFATQRRIDLGWHALMLGKTAVAQSALAAADHPDHVVHATALAALAHGKPAEARRIAATLPARSALRQMLETLADHHERKWRAIAARFGDAPPRGIVVTFVAAEAQRALGAPAAARPLYERVVGSPNAWMEPILVGKARERLRALDGR